MLSREDVKCAYCGRMVDESETIVTWDNLVGCSRKVCLKCFDKKLNTVIFRTLFENLDDVMKYSKSSEKVLDKRVETGYNEPIKNWMSS